MMPVGDFLRLLGIFDDEVDMVINGQPILLVLRRSGDTDQAASLKGDGGSVSTDDVGKT